MHMRHQGQARGPAPTAYHVLPRFSLARTEVCKLPSQIPLLQHKDHSSPGLWSEPPLAVLGRASRKVSSYEATRACSRRATDTKIRMENRCRNVSTCVSRQLGQIPKNIGHNRLRPHIKIHSGPQCHPFSRHPWLKPRAKAAMGIGLKFVPMRCHRCTVCLCVPPEAVSARRRVCVFGR